MKYKLAVLAIGLIAVVFLAGCGSGGSDFGSLFDFFDGSSGGNDIVTANLPGGSSSSSSSSPGSDTGGSSYSDSSPGSDTGSSSYSDSGSGDIVDHMPEPATLALLGSGLLAYALIRRKKKK